MARGKTIKLFLMDSDPSGRIKCTLTNWTGVAYKIPRTMLDLCKDMPLLKQSGVYFLFGTDDDNDNPVTYIGQAGVRKNGEGLLFRVQEPHDSIDYWTEVVMFTTTNNSFGPTEISYLENRFCNLAKSAGRYKIVNSVEPNPGNPTEETESELEEFIDYAKICLGSMGQKVLDPLISDTNADDNEPLLTMSYNSAIASGKRTSEGFVVLKGSSICVKTAPTCPDLAKSNREKYAEHIDENGMINADLLFSSPSGAASFVAGASVSGNAMWKDANGKALKDIEMANI